MMIKFRTQNTKNPTGGNVDKIQGLEKTVNYFHWIGRAPQKTWNAKKHTEDTHDTAQDLQTNR